MRPNENGNGLYCMTMVKHKVMTNEYTNNMKAEQCVDIGEHLFNLNE